VSATALQLPGLAQPTGWQVRRRSDPAALRLADRHYSRGRPGAPWVGPPSRVLVLVTGDETALWLAHWPATALAADGPDAWRCSLFRNEGSSLASALIALAMAAALRHWAEARPGSPWWAELPTDGWVTRVDPPKVASPNPGDCFIRAGWRRDRAWSHPRLVRLRAGVAG
jgi:hypothetical protein